MEKILMTAQQIGSPLFEQAEQLHRDILQFLENPKDSQLIQRMKEHAEKIEHETRDI
jgi:hypothetical protein